MKPRLLVLCMAACLSAGCSTMMEIRSEAAKGHEDADARARALLGAREAQVKPVTGPVVTDLPYVDARPIRRSESYPQSFYRQVTVNEAIGVPMQVLAKRLEGLLGVRVMYQSELLAPSVLANAGNMPAVRDVGMDATLAGLPPLPGASPMPAAAAASPASLVPISYTGDGIGLLNAVAAAINAAWEYDEAGRVVQFYRWKTETFLIPAVQGEPSSLGKMGGQSQSSQGGQGLPLTEATAQGEHKTTASVWAEIEAAIKAMLSSEGVYAIGERTGTVTVRDRPDRVEIVRRYLDEVAASLSRQVDMQVTIYRVVTNDRDTRGLNWNVLFQNMLGHYGFQITTLAGRPNVAGEGLSSFILSVPQRDSNGVPNRYGGSQMMLDALSRIGRTSVVQNSSILTANNKPAPFKVVKRTSYLARVSQNLSGIGGTFVNTGPTLEPGSVETGLNLYMLPHVQKDGKRLLLKLMMSLSSLESLDSFGTEQATIQLPQTASREFIHEVWLNSGETLVLAGFESVDTSMDTRSPLDRRLWLLGGRSAAGSGTERVVVTITPVVTAVRSRI